MLLTKNLVFSYSFRFQFIQRIDQKVLSNSHHSPTNITLQQGETLFKYLKNVSVPKKEGGPPIEFNNDGSLKSVEIRIVNLQLDVEASKTAQTDIKKWEEIGVWQATPKKSNDAVGLGIGDGLTSAALPYNHGTYSKVYIIKLGCSRLLKFENRF